MEHCMTLARATAKEPKKGDSFLVLAEVRFS